jgi:hypothetical protein
MVANLLIFLAASGITVKLLDFYMSDDKKKRLNDRVVRMWNWLDEARHVSLLDLARSARSKHILSIMLAGMVLLAVASPFLVPVSDGAGMPKDVAPTTVGDIAMLIVIWLAIAAPIILVGNGLVSIILRGKTPFEILVRTGVALCLACVPLFLALGVALIKYGWSILPVDTEVDLFYILLYFGLGLGIFLTGLLLLFWLIPVALILLVYVVSFVLYFSELTVRRIAEYPNGPLVAAGALLGLAGAAIKVLEGG